METPGEPIDDESRSPTNPGIGGPDPVMAAYLSELGIWLGLRNVKLPKDKKQGVQLALEVQGPRPIRPDITVAAASREWDWLADKVGPEKAFSKLGNRPCQKDYPKHDEHLPNRLPTTLNKAAGQKNPTDTNTASADAVEDSPKEYLPKSQDVLDALTEIEAESTDPDLIAQETNDQVENAFKGFDMDDEVVPAEQPELAATSDTLPFADPFAAPTSRTPIEAPLADTSDTSDEPDPFDQEFIAPTAPATDNGPDLTSNGEVTRVFNNLVLPGSGLNGDLDREEEKLFDSRVVSAPEQFPSRVPATPEDMALLCAAMKERLPPQPSLPREFAQMTVPRATDSTDAAPPPPKAMEVAVRPTIPIRRPGGPTTTDGLELTPPEAQPAAKASRSAIVNHIGIGLGVIGLMFFLGTLIVRRTPTTTTVRPTVCVSPGLQRSLPAEAQRNFFPCHQRGVPMFYCSITAAPSAEERAGFCRTIRASCVPPIGQNVTTSEQEACLADPYARPINH